MTDWKALWGTTVELVANSGIQFMDFSFAPEKAKGFSSEFIEDISNDGNQYLRKPSGTVESLTGNNAFYEFSTREVVNLFEAQWMPIPFFATEGARQGMGPFNWTRVRFLKKSSSDGDIYLVQLAIDTTINFSEAASGYSQPNQRDAEVEREFQFLSDFEFISQMLKNGCDNPETFQIENEGAWVSEWVKSNHQRFSLDEVQLNPQSKLEAWASYIAFIEFINHVIDFPKIKLKPSIYSQSEVNKIDVDLVLDIGNSRTCGLLVEIPQGDGQSQLDMEGVTKLCLRDLSEPSIEYDGLFESRVEFCDLNFGSDRFSRLSGRNNAFLWPSFVRFGPEAIRLVSKDRGNEAFSGISSPKRYLWDNALFSQRWRFHNWENEPRLPRSLAAMLPELTARGDSRAQLSAEVQKRLRDNSDTNLFDDATYAEFSKSSLYGFMVIEIIAQAFRQINDPKYRGDKVNRTISRSLRNVIITLPTATPRQEQAIVKSKVRGAIKLLWSRMANSGQVRPNTEPKLIVEWDEASCSQIMYLYSEIIAKFQGDMTNYLNVFGKSRIFPNEGGAVGSIRLACVDIGGGTTDLMVTTYYQQYDVSLTPVQDFREGFRKAGDDLLCLIIESIIIPQLRESLKTNGNSGLVDTVLMDCFGKSVAGRTSAQKHLQRQFTIKVLAPLALEILNVDFSESNLRNVSVIDLFKGDDFGSVSDYLDRPVREKIGIDWSIKSQVLSVSQLDLKAVINQAFKFIFENISEIISGSDVDLVLLTGRPSQNKLIIDLFKSCCSTAPNRVVSMSSYNTGAWYPFKSPQNTVGDPKSSVAVGAMLIALAGSRRLQGFYIPQDHLSMRETGFFVGKYQNIGKINKSDVYFSPNSEADGDDVEIPMMTDTFIGSRQLDLERWTATPLYKLYFSNILDGTLPYRVTLKKLNLPDDALYEPIKVVRAEDQQGRTRNANIKLRLQTLGANEEYWLDSGAFEV